jgi:hypothetical protein
MSSSFITNILTPPTTPDYLRGEQVFHKDNLGLVVFDKYNDIEFRGEQTHEGIRVKMNDLISYFDLNIDYMKTISRHLIAYSLKDLYMEDFNNITSIDNDPTLFSEYAQSYELYITYKGIDILAYNVPNLGTFRDWLKDNVLDLQCHEEIDYDGMGW